jgi:hypothetical protein
VRKPYREPDEYESATTIVPLCRIMAMTSVAFCPQVWVYVVQWMNQASTENNTDIPRRQGVIE